MWKKKYIYEYKNEYLIYIKKKGIFDVSTIRTNVRWSILIKKLHITNIGGNISNKYLNFLII
jgi:hypothetical protein